MEQINGEISGGGRKSIFLRDKLTGIDTGNEKSSNYFESSTSCFILNRGIDHIYDRPLFQILFSSRCSYSYAYREQRERRWIQQRDIKATWRSRIRMTRVCRMEKDQPRTSKLQNDRCFISISQIDLFKVETLLRISILNLSINVTNANSFLILNYQKEKQNGR